jgi:LmbE family N-acetylglucosaminyl deacetylase
VQSTTPLDIFCAGALHAAIRVMLVVAHPDDEVIGAASRLMAFGPSIGLVHLTDGAPRNMADARRAGCATRREYARIRHCERDAALLAGCITLRCGIALDIPDQDSSHRLGEVTRRIASLLAGHRTDIVATHAYEGGHPDHDAAAFAVQVACDRLGHEGRAPVRIEFASYYGTSDGICTGDFLPGTGSEVRTIELTTMEQAAKRRMLDAFMTQRETLRPFGTAHERFRIAPHYDFTRPPHAGLLYYERYDWGIQGDRWRSAAIAALRGTTWD